MSIQRPKITINVQDGGLGRTGTVGDGVGGLLLQIAAAPVTHAMGVAKAYSSYDDLPTELQIPAMDLYFKTAPGQKVWIMPVPNTATVPEMLDASDDDPYAKDLIEAGQGEIRFISIAAANLTASLATSITNAQALAVSFAATYDPFIVFIPVQYSAGLADLTTGSANRAGVFISETGKEAGLLIGRLASTPVQRHIGRIKDGAMPITEFYIGTALAEDVDTLVTEVVGKGYICLGTIKGKSGYYYETQPLATDPSGDFAIIANRRVIDKAILIAYSTYVNELKDEIEIAADGTIAPGVVKHYQSLIENAVNLQMTANGNISGAKAYMDASQNVLSTGKLTVELRILPLAYAEEIVVNLGFTTNLED